MELRGKVALVSGGAHRVGKAIALALAHEGAHVVVHYGGSAEAASQTSNEIATLGVEAMPIQADLHDPAQIEALFQQVRDHFGRLDVLVNSASNFIKEPFDQISTESWQEALDVNLTAPFLMIQQAARLMRAVERDAGEPAAIINISDLAGLNPWHNFVQHGVSKAGLLHLTRITAYELAPGIRVNAIIPGAILPPANMDSERWNSMGDAVPLKRTGNPGFIQQTVIFLAKNDFITGAVIPVDGGEHLIGARPY